VGGMSACAM